MQKTEKSKSQEISVEPLLLPRFSKKKDCHYISYSQVGSWEDEKSFNLGIKGRLEYILGYFFGVQFPDQGWGVFGEDAENAVCYRDYSKEEIADLDEKIKIHNIKHPNRPQRLVSDSLDSFDEREMSILKQITPLGTFQKEGWINFDGFKLLLYIDDATEDFKKLRDYKTASRNSGKKYELPEYKQLDVYSIWVEQEYDYIPDELEVCVIERAGNCYGMVERRDLLSVKKDVWYIDRKTSPERLQKIKDNIIKVANEISEYYKVYLKLKDIK